jgi:3-oxoacyl-[acyl-carrier-protein] synthase II
MNTRVVITGTGIISSVGNTVGQAWDAVLNGRCGIAPITRFDATDFRTSIAGEVKDFDATDYIDKRSARRLDPFCHYGVAATLQAMAESGLDMETTNPERVGVFVGSGIGGIGTEEANHIALLERGPGRVSPFLIPMLIADMASGAISIEVGAKGPNFAITSACATGSHAIGEAFWVLKRGDADVMIAGGAEASITPTAVGGFCAMKAMSARNDSPTSASRPFDAERDGFVIAEGAGVVVMETLEHAQARGAEILAELVGYSATGDAYHITSPAPDGEGAARAIRQAVSAAGVTSGDIGYINAHGTSTKMNDKYETMALKSVFGQDAYNIPVSSTKALTGHALGAAGGIECIFCVKAIADNTAPGTYNYENPDPECDLDYIPNTSREGEIDVAMNMNFGFGGHNAVLVFKRFTG